MVGRANQSLKRGGGTAKSRRVRRIGLLGGSFNPAHDGHRHISLAAIRRLGLDEVWWLVSPQNPLKPVEGMSRFEARFSSAKRVARHPRIRVTGFERDMGLQYTADTLEAIRVRHPDCRFVWLMGADNLGGFHRWERWERIAAAMPIAVFARPGYDLRALAGVAAQRFKHVRLPECRSRTLVKQKPPAWVFLAIRRHPESATRIRQVRSGRKTG
ncbi:nicotinate-nucleotide adenylyltransferase [Aestuariispira insulae]|nr:nicotinate-nucleotide adenylyltransferase [Aestuariispira insulae]